MPTLVWVVAAGAAMSLLALTGSLTLLLPERTFKQLVLPLVALAAGSLVGGALFPPAPPRPSPASATSWSSTAG